MKKWIWISLGLLCNCVQSMNADGGFVAESAVAKVSIPDQRALIHFSDGVETLVIDNITNFFRPFRAWTFSHPSPG